jgi:hypothetical protein
MRLAVKHGADKAGVCNVYEVYFAPLRHQAVNLFEIGVGGYDDPKAGGASVRMWKDYFSKAKIYALDFYDKSPHAEERITIFRGSQDDEFLLNRIADEIGGIDVILDDGSHVSAHMIRSFETLFPRLNPGGFYIVEDLGTSYWPELGGSHDLDAPDTAMQYFKRLVDGINFIAMRQPYTPSYAARYIEFLHFYQNLVVIKKKRRGELPSGFGESQAAIALDDANRRIETLRTRRAKLEVQLAEVSAERDAFAAAAKQWYDAATAGSADRTSAAEAVPNTVPPARGCASGWRVRLGERLIRPLKRAVFRSRGVIERRMERRG